MSFNEDLHRAIERNDKIDKTTEILVSLQKVMQFLEDEEGNVAETFWKDKAGYGFSADIGYLFQGLNAVESYLEKRLVREADDP